MPARKCTPGRNTIAKLYNDLDLPESLKSSGCFNSLDFSFPWSLRQYQYMQHLYDQYIRRLINKKCKRHDGAVMNRVRVGAEKLEHFCEMPASNVDGTSVIPTAPHETISIPCMIVQAPRRPLCLCRPHDSIPCRISIATLRQVSWATSRPVFPSP